MSDGPVEQALAELQDLVRCRCHPAYTGRGLHDPDCECDSTEAVTIVSERITQLAKACAEWAEVSQSNYQRAKAAGATLEKLIGGAETVLEAWDHHMRDVVVPGSLHDAIEELRADVVEAMTASAAVKDYLTPEDEKQSHEWKCPIDYPGCRKNCGSYGCGN